MRDVENLYDYYYRLARYVGAKPVDAEKLSRYVCDTNYNPRHVPVPCTVGIALSLLWFQAIERVLGGRPVYTPVSVYYPVRNDQWSWPLVRILGECGE